MVGWKLAKAVNRTWLNWQEKQSVLRALFLNDVRHDGPLDFESLTAAISL